MSIDTGPSENEQAAAPHSGDNDLTRREFVRNTAVIAASTLAMGHVLSSTAAAASSRNARNKLLPLDLAEWSYFWVGVERAEVASGTYVNGKQMYVEYWLPREVKHPYPIVLVHGGGGQGLDWIGTPDGRRGWAPMLVEQGYRVYVVDRPGHGRSPFHPDLHRAFPPQHLALEVMSGRFTPPNRTATAPPLPFQKYHNQWPGNGEVGSAELDQLVSSQGGSYVYVPAPPGAPASGLGAISRATDQPPAPAMPNEGLILAHTVWRERGAMLLDKIGPAIIMTHSAGGPFGWLVAEVRPNLVKGIVAVEGGGLPLAGANIWGMSTIPMTFDPPLADPSQFKKKLVPSPEEGVSPYWLQEDPPRQLVNLKNIPVVIVTAEGSFASPGNPGAIAFFKQAGVKAEELRYAAKNIHGNGHMMMVEKNNREALQPLIEWMTANVEKGAPAPSPARSGETALKLADYSFFWVGAEHKKMPYGTILAGQMYVQEMIPAQITQRYPIVLVHGGGGQMTHYMGIGDGQAGWAHYYLQKGYRVFLVDRPGHGRVPYHPDSLGPIGDNVSYQLIVNDFRRTARGPNRRWPGTGDVGDPSIDQFMAGQNSSPRDNEMAHRLWATRGAMLLDRIGPAIIQVHSAGGPFGYLVANERPQLVKAIVNFEGAGVPFSAATPWGITAVPLAFDPPVTNPSELALQEVKPQTPGAQPYKLQSEGNVRKLKNLQNIPTVFVSAENSGRTQGEGQVAFFKQAGVPTEHLRLADLNILGNGHFMMLEDNRKQAFDVIESWIAKTVRA